MRVVTPYVQHSQEISNQLNDCAQKTPRTPPLPEDEDEKATGHGREESLKTQMVSILVLVNFLVTVVYIH